MELETGFCITISGGPASQVRMWSRHSSTVVLCFLLASVCYVARAENGMHGSAPDVFSSTGGGRRKLHGADASRQVQNSEQNTEEGSRERGNINRNAIEENNLSGEVAGQSMHRVLSNLEESALNFPNLMDGMLESALSSFDRAAGGLFSGLTETKIDFAESDDKSRLIVRVHMREAENGDSESGVPKKIHAAVVGHSHLRIRIEKTSDGFQSISSQTIALPAKVSMDGVEILSKTDGTVHISLRILSGKELESEGSASEVSKDDGASRIAFPLVGRLFPPLFNADLSDAASAPDYIREIPSSAGIKKCRETYKEDRLSVSKCICDVTSDVESRAVCYGNLISKSVSLARRLGNEDFATAMKHDAISCANGLDDKVSCLGTVAKKIVEYLYRRKGSRDREGNLTNRIRQAIESEDNGPSSFHSSPGIIVWRVIVFIGFLLIGFLIMGLTASRRRSISADMTTSLSSLSSVLTQNAKSTKQSQSMRSQVGAGNGNVPGKMNRSAKLA